MLQGRNKINLSWTPLSMMNSFGGEMKSLYKVSKALDMGKVTSVELTEKSLKIALENEHNAYISILEDLALRQAKESDRRIKEGKRKSSLDGVPFSLKDLFITKGIRTTGGSRILYNYIPQYEGGVSGFLQEAGGVLLGKVGCDEFGMGSTNEKTIFGPVYNPLNKEYVAGGSSGGSAGAVAEGSSYYSIGTDTGGSSRLPANFCGLVGYKPSYGLVTRYGQLAYGSSLDQPSPMAADVMSIGCIMESLAQKDDRDASQFYWKGNEGKFKVVSEMEKVNTSYLKGKVLGYDPAFLKSCDPEIQEKLEDALRSFKDSGGILKEISLPHLKYSVSVYYILGTAEASANLSRYDGIHYGLRVDGEDLIDTYRKSRTQGFGDEVKKRIILGTFALSSGYQDEYFSQASKVRQLIAMDFKKAYETCDMIFAPVSANKAFKLGEGIKDPVKMYMNDLYTIPVNLAGLCSLAMPWGEKRGELPTGFQLMGPSGEDKKLLIFSRAFEKIKEEASHE